MNPDRARWALWSVWVTISVVAACQLGRPVMCATGLVSLAGAVVWATMTR